MDGQQIRQRRLQLGLTQAQLAAKVGVDVKTVSRWENGKMRPSKWVLPTLVRAFESIERKRGTP